MSVFPSGVTLLSQNQRGPWLVEGFPYTCEIAKLFPFRGVDGLALEFGVRDRIDVISDSDPADILYDGVTITMRAETPETAYSPPYQIGEFATGFVLPYFQQDTITVPNDLESVAGQMAIRRLTYAFFKKISRAAGSGNLGDFNGLLDPLTFLTAGQTVDLLAVGPPTAPAVLTLPKIDEAFYKVTDGAGRPNAIMAHPRAIRQIKKTMYDAGLNLDCVDWEWDDPLRGKVLGKVPAWEGVPILTNELIEISTAGNGKKYSPVFFMVLGDSGGPGPGRGITGIIPKGRVGNMFVSRRRSGGNTDANIYVDVTWPVGLAMGSRAALSVLTGFELQVS